MLVPTVVTMHLLRLNAARTTMWAPCGVLLVVVLSVSTWSAVLSLLTLGTCMLTSIILGRSDLVNDIVRVLLFVRLIIRTLGRDLTITVNFVCISLRLLVTII